MAKDILILVFVCGGCVAGAAYTLFLMVTTYYRPFLGVFE